MFKLRWCVVVVEEWFTALTGGEAGPLVAAGELDVEVGDQGMDVIVPLHLQAEGWGEAQVLQLHCVDIHLLENIKKKPRDSTAILVTCSEWWAVVVDADQRWR